MFSGVPLSCRAARHGVERFVFVSQCSVLSVTTEGLIECADVFSVGRLCDGQDPEQGLQWPTTILQDPPKLAARMRKPPGATTRGPGATTRGPGATTRGPGATNRGPGGGGPDPPPPPPLPTRAWGSTTRHGTARQATAPQARGGMQERMASASPPSGHCIALLHSGRTRALSCGASGGTTSPPQPHRFQ